ncbi:hypothetical protein [Shewanella sp.]|uniref:hypothetical protein n=1 Tax=Shewanella sp. TaxID=50422 RepID=UPI003A96BE9B
MIYKLMEQPHQYKSLDLDMLTLFEKVGSEELGLKIFQQADTNLSLAKDWVAFDCDYFEEPDADDLQAPDVFLWLESYLVLTETAQRTLASYLEGFGEFLPISVSGEPHYLFNCMTLGKEDESATEYKLDGGLPTGITKLAFLPDDVENKTLFKSQISFCSSLFGNTRFKQLCDENRLNGLRFEEDLAAIF